MPAPAPYANTRLSILKSDTYLLNLAEIIATVTGHEMKQPGLPARFDLVRHF